MDENLVYKSLKKDDFVLYKKYKLDFGSGLYCEVECVFDKELWEKVLQRQSDGHKFIIEEDLDGCFVYDENNQCINPLFIPKDVRNN